MEDRKAAAPVGSAIPYRINVAEAKLDVSRSTIYRLVKDGQLDPEDRQALQQNHC